MEMEAKRKKEEEIRKKQEVADKKAAVIIYWSSWTIGIPYQLPNKHQTSTQCWASIVDGAPTCDHCFVFNGYNL